MKQQKMYALLAAALLSIGVTTSVAQAQQDAGAPEAAQMNSADVSDAHLEQFIEASEEVATISQEYTERLSTAGDEADQQALRVEANEKMIEAIEDSGLDVDTFNNIGQTIQQDPELMSRVQEMAES
ncbi:DUF4168 domain-containing protein [Vreelandella venusta]|uniref:DUF4168 domain-containing protein n=1 Tax=Vreelandella venusta TaxID=44935 RepID=UPI003850C63E